jgi:putative transposase
LLYLFGAKGVDIPYIAIEQASEKWAMPIQNWKSAMSRFIIEFGDRITRHL